MLQRNSIGPLLLALAASSFGIACSASGGDAASSDDEYREDMRDEAKSEDQMAKPSRLATLGGRAVYLREGANSREVQLVAQHAGAVEVLADHITKDSVRFGQSDERAFVVSREEFVLTDGTAPHTVRGKTPGGGSSLVCGASGYVFGRYGDGRTGITKIAADGTITTALLPNDAHPTAERRGFCAQGRLVIKVPDAEMKSRAFYQWNEAAGALSLVAKEAPGLPRWEYSVDYAAFLGPKEENFFYTPTQVYPSLATTGYEHPEERARAQNWSFHAEVLGTALTSAGERRAIFRAPRPSAVSTKPGIPGASPGAYLWVTDGTVTGTRMIEATNIIPLGFEGTLTSRAGVYVSMLRLDTLLTSDGTVEGTHLIKPGLPADVSPTERTVLAGTELPDGRIAVLTGLRGAGGETLGEIWTFDLAGNIRRADGPFPLEDHAERVFSLVAFGDSVAFRGSVHGNAPSFAMPTIVNIK